MRDYADWRIPWLSMGLLVLLVALTVALAFFQLFLKFDLETSPAWQVGVHYMMLFSFLSIMFVSASIRGMGSGEIFRRVMLALAFLTPVAVFFVGLGAFWRLLGIPGSASFQGGDDVRDVFLYLSGWRFPFSPRWSLFSSGTFAVPVVLIPVSVYQTNPIPLAKK